MPRVGWQQCLCLLRPVKGNLSHTSLLAPGGLLAVFGFAWLVDSIVSSHRLPSVRSCLSSYGILFRTPVILD